MSTTLPVWDLSAFYSGMDDPKLDIDIDAIQTLINGLREKYQGKVTQLSAEAFLQALKDLEVLEDKIGRIGSYAFLVFAEDSNDAKRAQFYQKMLETVNTFYQDLLFFRLEAISLTDEQVASHLQHEGLKPYKNWFVTTRQYKPYTLDEATERLLAEKNLTSRQAWIRLYDEHSARMRFDVDGVSHTSTDILNMMASPDALIREKAALAFSRGLTKEAGVFTMVTNTLAKDKAIDDKLRGYPSPEAGRHLDNQVEPEVVEALVNAVTAKYESLAHTYYAYKAKAFGVEKLKFWDRNAPYPGDVPAHIEWDEAKYLVQQAYGGFSPEIARISQQFFDNNWIHAQPGEGKYSGAFSHPTVPSAHPLVLLSFYDKLYDVMTLAHELGHGVHQVLAAEQGPLLADTPLTLAETASVFGEMLTFQHVLSAAPEPKRKFLLAKKIEDMLNTVVRQISFYKFESRVHAARAQGELSTEEISDIWMETQRESLGPHVELPEDYRIYWAYIPHFIHSPFYVYAYAFGDCLVNSLYQVYQEQPEGFADKYVELLKAGGSKHHKELLEPFGLDASDPAFWHKGLGLIESFISQLEQLG